VTADELRRTAEAIRVGESGAEGFTEWEHLHPDAKAYFVEFAKRAASVLRPEGSVLIGGTCKSCAFSYKGLGGNRLRCENGVSPADQRLVSPDFGCTHFTPGGEE